jgi:hypothetical protein
MTKNTTQSLYVNRKRLRSAGTSIRLDANSPNQERPQILLLSRWLLGLCNRKWPLCNLCWQGHLLNMSLFLKALALMALYKTSST